jgi:hypothetical protein
MVRVSSILTMSTMKVINKKTGIDVTSYVLQLLEGKITKQEFEKLTKLK